MKGTLARELSDPELWMGTACLERRHENALPVCVLLFLWHFGILCGCDDKFPQSLQNRVTGFSASYQRRMAPPKCGCREAESKPTELTALARAGRTKLCPGPPIWLCWEERQRVRHFSLLPASHCRGRLLPSREPPRGCRRPTQINPLAQLAAQSHSASENRLQNTWKCQTRRICFEWAPLAAVWGCVCSFMDNPWMAWRERGDCKAGWMCSTSAGLGSGVRFGDSKSESPMRSIVLRKVLQQSTEKGEQHATNCCMNCVCAGVLCESRQGHWEQDVLSIIYLLLYQTLQRGKKKKKKRS